MTYQEALDVTRDLFFDIKQREPFKVFKEDAVFIGLIVLPSDMPQDDFMAYCKIFEVDTGSFIYIQENNLLNQDLSIRACYLSEGGKWCVPVETFFKSISN